MTTAQDKLKALIAARAAAKKEPITKEESNVKIKTTGMVNSTTAAATPNTSPSASDKIAALKAKAANLAAVRSGKKLLVPVESVESTTSIQEMDTTAEKILASFKPTDEMNLIDGFDADTFITNLNELNESLEAKAPNIGEYLHLIHKNLSKYPELTHLLDDEQIGVVVSGLLRHTNTELAIKSTKSRSTKKSAPISIDMAMELF